MHDTSKQSSLFLFVLGMLLVLATGCAVHENYVEDIEIVPLVFENRLPASADIYVAMPQELFQVDGVLIESGDTVQNLLRQAFSHTPGKKVYASAWQDKNALFEAGRSFLCDYVVLVSLSGWQKNSAQAGEGEASATITVYEPRGGTVVRKDDLLCKGVGTSIGTAVRYSPEHCLRDAFQAWVREVFSR